MNFLLVLPILFPFLCALYLFFREVEEKYRNRVVFFCVLFNFLLVLLNVFYFKNSFFHVIRINSFFDIALKVDLFGLVFSFLVSTLWIFAAVYAMGYFSHEKNIHTFFVFFCATLGAVIGLSFSGNLFTLFLFYELLTFVTFPLFTLTHTKEAFRSGYKYLTYSISGTTASLIGILLIFNKVGSLDFIPGGILSDIAPHDYSYYLLAYGLTFLGFGVKAGLVPFHSWLPSAMIAPTPVSALLDAVAVVKSGIFALTRITYFVFGPVAIMAFNGNTFALIFILITIVAGSFLALHQKNLKKRLAYSTISQLGYIMLGLVVFTPNSFVGGMLHMIFHAVIKITLFFCVGAIMHVTRKTSLDEIAGIGKQLPKLMWCFSLCSISLIGIPPTAGYVSKWYLATGSLQYGNVFVPIVLLLSALLTTGYLFPIISTAFFMPLPEKKPHVHSLDKRMLIPIIVLTATVITIGFLPNPLIEVLTRISNLVM